MTTVLLVRHGESAANRDNVFAGNYDAELLPRGFEQARLTARYIKENFVVDAVYSSDLKRAYNTGKCIADALGLTVETDKRFREIDAGAWDGVAFEKIIKTHPEEFKTWVYDIGHGACPGGENIGELGTRVMTALKEKAEENDGKTILIASHATAVRVAYAMAKYGSAGAMERLSWPSNASVSVLYYENGNWSTGEYCIDAHMKDLRTALPESI
ncbi:MAG: histidine phosphatase family protein [Oscillospiraceae bacterium]|nr:histidine phosphatase family protein [Oscillospiraceae bacterium]